MLAPLFEMVVMSLMPLNSAVLLISLTRISAIPSNAGNSSAIGAVLRGLIVLMPSMLIDNMLGLLPATERFPLLSISTPACVVRVVIGLVEPRARDAMATGRSTNSRPCLVSAMFETSVLIGGSLAALTSID